MANFVYAMYAGDFIKIGITSSLNRRINQVQTGTPILIHRVRYVELKNRVDSIRDESMLHDVFSNKRTYGEWFFNHIASTDKFIDYFKSAKDIRRGEMQIDESPRKILELHKINKIEDVSRRINKLSVMRENVISTYQEKFIYKDKDYILCLIDESIKSSIENVLTEVVETVTDRQNGKYDDMSIEEHIKLMKNRFKLSKINKSKERVTI